MMLNDRIAQTGFAVRCQSLDPLHAELNTPLTRMTQHGSSSASLATPTLIRRYSSRLSVVSKIHEALQRPQYLSCGLFGKRSEPPIRKARSSGAPLSDVMTIPMPALNHVTAQRPPTHLQRLVVAPRLDNVNEYFPACQWPVQFDLSQGPDLAPTPAACARTQDGTDAPLA